MGLDRSLAGGHYQRTSHVSLRALVGSVADAGWTPDLAVLAALLALTTVFGRPFSKLGDHSLHLYVTEPALLATFVFGIARCGPRGAWARVRDAVPKWALLVLWLAGAIASIRGLGSFGMAKVVDDIGLVEYSVLLALVPIVIDNRRRAMLLFRVLVAASLASAVLYAVLRFAYPTDTPLASPDYAVGIYLSIFVLAVAGRLAMGMAVEGWVLALAVAVSALMAWLPARTVWLAMIAAAVAIAGLAPRGQRLRVAGFGVAAFVVALVLAYPLQRIEDSRLSAATTAAAAPNSVGPQGYVADDGLSAFAGGRLVRGGAARGVLSRQVPRHVPLDLGSLEGLQVGKAYTVTFAAKPLSFSPNGTVIRVGDTAGAGWGAAVVRLRPKAAWRFYTARLVATAPTERFALIVDAPGAANVRFDALRVELTTRASAAPRAGAPSPAAGQSRAARPKQGAGAGRSRQPAIVSAVAGTFDPNVAAPKTENLNMRWRLAIWGFQLRKWADEPLLGVGFGRPTDFRWGVTGGVYDARTGSGPQDVTGPHNSFVNLLFRTGLLGVLPLLALVVLAAARLRRWLAVPRPSEDRAIVVALGAVFVFVTVTACFSVALEGPYMGMFFWAALALLFVTPPLLAREPAVASASWSWGGGLSAPVPVRARLAWLAAMPWPLVLIALWTAVLQVGGPRVAKLGLSGPIYPNEVIFAVAFAALALRPTWRRERLSAIRANWPPRWAQAAVLVFAVTFAVALIRGGLGYGRGAVQDAGLGYVLLIPLIAVAFVRRRDWQEGFLRVLFAAGVVVFPVLVLEYGAGTNVNPLSLSIGFVLLFSLAPMLDDWLHGALPWYGRVYVVAAPAFVFWQVKSRSALSSLAVGLLLIFAFNIRGSRRVAVAVSAVAVLLVAGIALAVVAPSAFDRIPPVKLAESTLNLSPNTKGNNARWRLDFAGALLHRSVESVPDATVGVGFGKPSRFLWHEDPFTVQAYDFRGTPIPKGVVPNGDVSGPHNGFVDLVYRLGWPGALAFAAILMFAIRAGVQALRRARGADARAIRVLLAATVAGIIVLLTSDALRVPEAAVPFACAVGLLAARGLTRSRDAGEPDPTDLQA